VLAGAVPPGPIGHLERQALRSRGLLDDLDHARELPGQSPW
jgi:hypothetical protein